MKLLQEKIALIQSSPTQDGAFLHFNQLMQEYGYTNNVYTFMNDHPSVAQKAKHGLATTYPQDWLDFYNKEQYQKIDAVWERLLSGRTPFFWGELVKHLVNDRRVSDDKRRNLLKVINEAEDAGVADGIGISYVNSLGEIVGIGLSRARAEKENSYEDMAEILLLSTFFHEKFLSFYKNQDIPNLSLREREVLLWASENKTDFEIAKIMKISGNTVRFHWKSIFRKMGTYGRLPSIIKGMRLQIITPNLVIAPYQSR